MSRRCFPRIRAGFSLVELSVVMVILAILATSGLEAAAIYLNHTAVQTTTERLAVIDNALRSYVRIYGRLPCPADRTVAITDGTTNGGYGKEYCNGALAIGSTGVWQGMVPFRDLNLPMEVAVDGWGDRFNYLVTSRLTATSTYFAYPETIDVRTGILATTCTTMCQDVGMAAYFIFSNGSDRRGGVTPGFAGSSAKGAYPCIPSPGSAYDQRVDTQNCNYTCGTTYGNCNTAIGVSMAANIVYDSRYNTGAEHGKPRLDHHHRRFHQHARAELF
ncbi:MAG: type II secretion system protein [Alphaproteobacteria bacterium]